MWDTCLSGSLTALIEKRGEKGVGKLDMEIYKEKHSNVERISCTYNVIGRSKCIQATKMYTEKVAPLKNNPEICAKKKIISRICNGRRSYESSQMFQTFQIFQIYLANNVQFEHIRLRPVSFYSFSLSLSLSLSLSFKIDKVKKEWTFKFSFYSLLITLVEI